MTDEKFGEILAVIKNDMEYIRTHLKNIDSHLGRVNDKISQNSENIASNKTSISKVWWVIGIMLLGTISIIIQLVIR